MCSAKGKLLHVIITQFVYTVEPLHNGHVGDRRKWPLWRGGSYGEVGV